MARLDLLRRRVDVLASTSEVAGRLVEGPPKTYERRSAPLPSALCEIEPRGVVEK